MELKIYFGFSYWIQPGVYQFRIASPRVEETDVYAKVTIGKVVLKPSKLAISVLVVNVYLRSSSVPRENKKKSHIKVD